MKILLCLPLMFALFTSEKPPAFSYGYVELEGNTSIYVALADDNEERQYGLMNRVEWGRLQGMWFDFWQDRSIRMWMKNTLLPIDFVFINAENIVVGLHENAVPMSEAVIFSPAPARYVLELPAGQVEALNIEVGDELRFSSQ